MQRPRITQGPLGVPKTKWHQKVSRKDSSRVQKSSMTSWPNNLPSGKHRFGIEVQHDEARSLPSASGSVDLCLPRLTARRNRPNVLRDWQQRGEIKTLPERFASIKFSTLLDRISSLMCVIFRIARKSLSVQRE